MENNPLRQYFRRPSVYLKLPSKGLDYSSDTIDMPETGDLPVYPMTAVDEITSRTPDALFNGVAVVELIKSCVPNIKDPWKINSNDIDAILIAIRAASGDDSFDIESTCPSCKEESSYALNLVGVLATIKPADYSKPLEIGELKVKYRPLTYTEMNQGAMGQFEVQQIFANIQNVEDEKEREQIIHQALERTTYLTMELLSKTIEYIETPGGSVNEAEFIIDFLKHCDRNVYVKIRDYNAELKKEAELKPLDVKCINCGHEYEQPFTLNPTDFFG